MDTQRVKEQVWALAAELNESVGAPVVEPHQQGKTETNTCLIYHRKTGDERLYIRPTKHGYSVALSNNSLVARMKSFMVQLTGSEPDRYYHAGLGREPLWKVNDFSRVREAAYYFAEITFPQDGQTSIISDIDKLTSQPDLSVTEREALISARLGQGTYRKSMLAIWNGACAVTGITVAQLLIASHAKPWALSTNVERLDPCNGLPLVATLDKLFDAYLIAFDPETGHMHVSDHLDIIDREYLRIPASLRKALNANQAHYLGLHFEVFKSKWRRLGELHTVTTI